MRLQPWTIYIENLDPASPFKSRMGNGAFVFRVTLPLILGGWGFAVPFHSVRSIYASGSVQDFSILFEMFLSWNHLNLFSFPGLLNTESHLYHPTYMFGKQRKQTNMSHSPFYHKRKRKHTQKFSTGFERQSRAIADWLSERISLSVQMKVGVS